MKLLVSWKNMGFLIFIMMYMFYIYKFGIRKIIGRILETEFFNIILNETNT